VVQFSGSYKLHRRSTKQFRREQALEPTGDREGWRLRDVNLASLRADRFGVNR